MTELTSTCGSALYRHAIVISSPGDDNGTEDVVAAGAAAEGDGTGSLTSSAGHDCAEAGGKREGGREREGEGGRELRTDNKVIAGQSKHCVVVLEGR